MKYLYIVLLLIIITLLLFKSESNIVNTVTIDSLRIERDTINNTIKLSEEKVKEVIKIYEEKINNIDSISMDSNCFIFSKFVSCDTL